MALQKVISLTRALEDPEHPSLGPVVKGLCLCGLWRTGNKFIFVAYNLFHFTAVLFFLSQTLDLYMMRQDLNKLLNNMSLTALSAVCVLKCLSYILWEKEWRELAYDISREELRQLEDRKTKKLMNVYITYIRVVTLLYWVMVFLTCLLLVITPLLKYVSSKSYRENIKSEREPLPQIICSWFPFDNTKMPGYIAGVFVHIFMGTKGSAIIAVFDTNAVAIMTYLKGQIIILREKCKYLFEEDITRQEILDRIRECHRHHSVLVKHYRMFNVLLSPVMFLYVLISSVTICCSVVQFSSKEATSSQKLWAIQYFAGLISQLFLYCWHSNEVAHETSTVDQGVYESDWWRGDVKLRRQVLLLAAKLDNTLILDAGPYATLSVSAFIDIMKGSYSFYTLFSQMQDQRK